MGFRGRYALEGAERLDRLTARLGDELALLRGQKAQFAPHWNAPDSISHKLRSELPLWVVGSLFGLLALFAFSSLNFILRQQTQKDLLGLPDIVKASPQTAHFTIRLP